MPDPETRNSAQAGRERNERHVLQVLLDFGQITQAEIAQCTGLSRATVSDIVGALQRSGLVSRRAGARPPTTSGRPPKTIALDGEAGEVLGLDIGRDHLRLVHSGVTGGERSIRELELLEHPGFEISKQPERSLRQATDWIRRFMEGRSWDRLVGIGVSVAGPIDHGRGDLATPSAMAGWRGISIIDELRNRLGHDVCVSVENGATLGALAELRWGAARGYRDVAYVTISHGIGLGLVVNGQLMRGARGYAGELGHTPAPAPDRPAPEAGGEAAPRCDICGITCLETIASAQAVAERLGVEYSSARFAELAEEATREPDGGSRRTALNDAARDIGRSLAGLVGILNPELILIGGLYGDCAFEIGYDGLMRELRTRCYAPLFESVAVRKAMRGRRGPAEGAVLLVLERELSPYLQRRLAAPAPVPVRAGGED